MHTTLSHSHVVATTAHSLVAIQSNGAYPDERRFRVWHGLVSGESVGYMARSSAPVCPRQATMAPEIHKRGKKCRANTGRVSSPAHLSPKIAALGMIPRHCAIFEAEYVTYTGYFPSHPSTGASRLWCHEHRPISRLRNCNVRKVFLMCNIPAKFTVVENARSIAKYERSS